MLNCSISLYRRLIGYYSGLFHQNFLFYLCLWGCLLEHCSSILGEDSLLFHEKSCLVIVNCDELNINLELLLLGLTRHDPSSLIFLDICAVFPDIQCLVDRYAALNSSCLAWICYLSFAGYAEM